MKYPNFNEEKKLWIKGYDMVVGIDEAGRGPLAGPVVAAAVAVNSKSKIINPKQIPNFKSKNFKCGFGVSGFKNLDLFRISDLGFRISMEEAKDSKLISEKMREKLYKILTNCSLIGWGIGRVSEKVIDKINILEATKLAMLKAVRNFEKKLKKGRKPQKSLSLISYDRRKFTTTSSALKMFLIIDGNFRIYSDIPQKSIIKGDQKVFSVAAASIIAKVYRDRLMEKYHKKYPQYGFDIHKGYPTKLHCKALEKYGPCGIHRKTFYPVKKYYLL